MGISKKSYIIFLFVCGVSFFLGGCSLGKGQSASMEQNTTAAPTQIPGQDVLLVKGATILTEENVQIKLRRQKIVQAISSDDCVTVTSEGKVTAVQPGRSVVTVTDDNGYEYEFPVWVREKNSTLKKHIQTVIIGNSLMGKGHFQSGLETAATAFGQQMTVKDFSKDGYMLEEHLSEMKRGKRPKLVKAIKNADVLIIQGMSGDDASVVIQKMREYCQPKTRIYYYETEFMVQNPNKWFGKVQKAREQKKADAIMIEKMICATYDLGYTYTDYHVTNDYHPNVFNCHLAALMAYAQIFGETCSEYPEALIDQRFYNYLKGENQQEQTEQFYKMCDIIDEQLKEYSSKTMDELMENGKTSK